LLSGHFSRSSRETSEAGRIEAKKVKDGRGQAKSQGGREGKEDCFASIAAFWERYLMTWQSVSSTPGSTLAGTWYQYQVEPRTEVPGLRSY